jgi:hypothetical protein
MEFSGVELLYGGMLEPHRGRGWFANLLKQAKELKTPLRAVAKRNPGNLGRIPIS